MMIHNISYIWIIPNELDSNGIFTYIRYPSKYPLILGYPKYPSNILVTLDII